MIIKKVIGELAVTLCCISSFGCRTAVATHPSVVLFGADGKEVPVRVEIAREPEERERGLMFRRTLAADAGMIFIYPAEGRLSFWMKNTYIPLDMIFINDAMRIVGIIENAQPLTLDARGVDVPARFVLEVNAFFSHRHGIMQGSRVRFEDLPSN